MQRGNEKRLHITRTHIRTPISTHLKLHYKHTEKKSIRHRSWGRKGGPYYHLTQHTFLPPTASPCLASRALSHLVHLTVQVFAASNCSSPAQPSWRRTTLGIHEPCPLSCRCGSLHSISRQPWVCQTNYAESLRASTLITFYPLIIQTRVVANLPTLK